jgi:Mitochondrial ribosomal subunit protein
VSKLPLSSEAARHKFKVLAGCRYDTVKDTFKIGCDRFPAQKMNEKWCSDTIVKLLAEAEVQILSFPSLLPPFAKISPSLPHLNLTRGRHLSRT